VVTTPKSAVKPLRLQPKMVFIISNQIFYLNSNQYIRLLAQLMPTVSYTEVHNDKGKEKVEGSNYPSHTLTHWNLSYLLFTSTYDYFSPRYRSVRSLTPGTPIRTLYV
jgi:hypothetical protein